MFGGPGYAAKRMSKNHPTTLGVYTLNTLVLKLNMETNFVS